MSLANLIVQGDRAYLVSDSGAFEPDGTIIWHGDKTRLFPEYAVALTCTGRIRADDIHAAMMRLEPLLSLPDNGREFVAILPFYINNALVHLGRNPDADDAEVVALVAHYSKEYGCAAGWVVCTPAAAWTIGNPEPWAAHPVGSVLVPMVDASAVLARNVSLTDPASFCPESDMKALVDAQREPKTGWIGMHDGVIGVSGTVMLTCVSVHGITQQEVCVYPDSLGEPAFQECA